MDYIINLDKIKTSSNQLTQTKGKIETLYNNYTSSYLSSLSSTEISSQIRQTTKTIERLKKGVINSDTWLKKYYNEVNEVENKISSFQTSDVTSPQEFKGEFIDIFSKVTIPAIQTNGDPNINSNLIPNHDNMLGLDYNNQDFYVVDTKISVTDYAAYLQKNGMTQNNGLLGGDCMLLSQYYAMDMLRGTYTSKSTMRDRGGGPATRMNEKCLSGNANDVLNYVYDEVSSGNPVVLQVTQKKSNQGLRHLVTVVGYRSDVKSASDLTPDKILVIDNVDGKIQTLSERNRTLYDQGRGYLAYGPTENFMSKEVNV